MREMLHYHVIDNAEILPRKHNGNRTVFDFFREINNSNFYWKILSFGHFFKR